MFEFSQHHGAVLHLVVQLQALNEVLEVAGFLGLLDVAVDWVELAGEEGIRWLLKHTDSKKTWQSLDTGVGRHTASEEPEKSFLFPAV